VDLGLPGIVEAKVWLDSFMRRKPMMEAMPMAYK